MIEKDAFVKILEDEISSLKNTKVFPLIQDLNNAIVFLCIFASKDGILDEKISFKFEKDKLIVSKDKDALTGTIYTFSSTDNLTSMKIVISKSFFYFERLNDSGSFEYKSSISFDKLGNFIRNASLTHEVLHTKQNIEEECFGNINDGVFFAVTNENVSKVKVEVFKLPDERNGTRIFYRYTSGGFSVMYRSIPIFKSVPFLETIGMNKLSELLTEQFEGDNSPLKIDDEFFFNKLIRACKSYYTKTKQQKNIEKKTTPN